MKLSSAEQEELFKALFAAYPNREKLKRMVKFKLDDNLDRFGGQSDLESVIFNLIEEYKEKILALIWGAYEGNPNNEDLQKVTFRFCSISKEQCNDLWGLIYQIPDKRVIEPSLCQAFGRDDIATIDPELSKIHQLELTEFKKMLEKNLIDKREKTKEEVPVVLALTYYLLANLEIGSLQEKLKTWTSQVARQLNISLGILKKNKAHQSDNIQLKIKPYLQVLIYPKGSDEFNLEAELVLEKDDSEQIIKRIPIFLDDEKVISSAKTNLATRIGQLIAKCNKIHLASYHHEGIIIELFLTHHYLTEPIELSEISIGYDPEKRWIGHEYKFLVRSLERLMNQEYGYLNSLKNKWKELQACLREPSNDEAIQQRFEQISLGNNFDWDVMEYELLEVRTDKIGMNCFYPLLNSQYCQYREALFLRMMRLGLPFVFWLRERPWEEIEGNDEFTQILTVENLKCLNKLLDKLRGIRRKAYIQKKQGVEHLGYHLGFLCDNPHRLPSKFDIKERQDDALVFGV